MDDESLFEERSNAERKTHIWPNWVGVVMEKELAVSRNPELMSFMSPSCVGRDPVSLLDPMFISLTMVSSPNW